jgi:hypothetical protein
MDGNPANQKLSAVCFKRTMRMEGKLCGSGTYETQTLLGLGVSVSDTCRCRTPTPTLIITFNYVFFSNYYQCRRVSVHIVSGVCVCVRAS